MIALIGSTDSKFILSEVCKEYEDLSNRVTTIQTLPEQLLRSDYECYVIDLDFFVEEPEEIVDTFLKLKAVSTAEWIFFARGYSKDSKVIKELRHHGFGKYVIAETIGDMERQLADCLSGKDNVEELNKLEKIRISDNREETEHSVSSKVYKTIGVCGAQTRIGTTMQAIQLVKYFQSIGIKACYIEANGSDHIQSIPTLYEVQEQDRKLGKIRFENMDFFYDLSQISEVLSLNYAVYVYDFGVLSEQNIYPYLEKDLKILVCGTLPWEMDSTNKSIGQLEDKEIQYIFNFTCKSIRNDLRKFMLEKSKDSYFSEWIPNIFSFCSANKPMYESIGKKISITETSKPPKKKKRFRR